MNKGKYKNVDMLSENDREGNFSGMKKLVEYDVEMWDNSWIGYIFFGLFVCVPSCIILYRLMTGDFKRELFGFIVGILFILIGIGCLVYIFYRKKRINQLYKHFMDGTIIVQKAEIVKFKFFSYPNTDNTVERKGIFIVAKLGHYKYRSEKIFVGDVSGDIDKKYYLKKGIPYGPKDPSYNSGYKQQVMPKIDYIDFQLRELYKHYNSLSWFEKYKIMKKIRKLKKEKSGLLPYSVLYRGTLYYIGDEIDVYIDPDNPNNYIM